MTKEVFMFMIFTPRQGWLGTKENRAALAIRIAQIVGYSDGCPPFEKRDSNDGMDWTLNAANDWWLHIKPDGTVEVQYRYKWSDEQWKALQTVIEMFVSKPKDD